MRPPSSSPRRARRPSKETATGAAEAVEGDPAEPFEYVYAEPTPRLEDQREDLERLRDVYGDEPLLEGE